MTQSTSTERAALLACPFCGSPPETTGPWEIGVSDNYETCICCEKCGFHISSDDGFASGEKQSLAKAIERWNRRAPAAPVEMPEPVAEVVECGVMGQQTVTEVNGAWQFLSYGDKLYAEADVRALLASARAVPQGWQITEAMHVAAVKVLHRAAGLDGLPQRMVDAMLAAATKEPAP